MTGRGRRTSLAVLLAATGSFLSGCATRPDCATVSPLQRYALTYPTAGRPSASAVAKFALNQSTLDDIACWASRGDKHAQFAFGLAYEGGLGVARDLDKARDLYRRAASSTVGNRSFYSAPVGNETYGTVITAPVGPAQPGLPEAAEALRRLSDD